MISNEKGFSLVELLVSMAILLVVGTALISFLAHCINQYTRGNQETTLQMEAQTSQNQLQEMVLQTNTGIALNSTKVSDTDKRNGRQLSLYNLDENGEPQRIRISIDYNTGNLNYQEFGLDKDKVLTGAETSNDDAWSIVKSDVQVFAAHVEDWEVTLWDEDGKQILNTSNENTPTPKKVKIWMKLKVGSREYESTQEIALRSKLYSSDKKSRYILSGKISE